jgi:hypothetical protein
LVNVVTVPELPVNTPLTRSVAVICVPPAMTPGPFLEVAMPTALSAPVASVNVVAPAGSPSRYTYRGVAALIASVSGSSSFTCESSAKASTAVGLTVP